MDSFTQIVLGVAVTNATLGRKISNKSILYGALLGTLPDLDVLVGQWFYDPISAVEIHRGFSHSILFFLVSSLVWAYLIYKLENKNKVTYKEAYIASFLVLFTHALLDVFTTWGTQLLWPLDVRFALKSIFVIDPLYTFPFLFFLIISLRQKKLDSSRYKWNFWGIAVSSFYLCITLFLQWNVTEKVRSSLEKTSILAQEITVKPTAFNTILWNIIVEGENAYYLSEYSFFDTKPLQFVTHHKNENLLQNLNHLSIVKQLKEISEQQYVITQREDTIVFNDLRFGLLTDESSRKQYAFSYLLYQENKEWKAIEAPRKRADGVLLLRKLANRIKGN